MNYHRDIPRVTIIALIFASPAYAKGFYEHLIESTPELKTGEAEFYFVANNANRATKRALKRLEIPHMEFETKPLTEAEQVKLGFGGPEYIGRVYSAYNFGVSRARGEIVALLNSDMIMSPGWLTKLLGFTDGKTIPSPQLVERMHPKFGLFPGALQADFGNSFKNFKSQAWSDYVRRGQSPTMVLGKEAPYMPSILRQEWFDQFGGFPPGNLIGQSGFGSVGQFGDQHFFEKLEKHGISHVSIDGVYCYHFKEGERASIPWVWWVNIFWPSVEMFMSKVKRRLLQALHAAKARLRRDGGAK